MHMERRRASSVKQNFINVLKRLGVRNPFRYEKKLERLSKRFGKDFIVIQIGANDGKSNDPIANFLHKFKPRAILIEPQPDIFNTLKKNYPGGEFPNFQLLNVAISVGFQKKLTMYRIKSDFWDEYRNLYKSWANPSGITSVYKNHVEEFLLKVIPQKCNSENVNQFIETLDVPCIKFSGLNISNDDKVALQVDAEGMDALIVLEVLKELRHNLPISICYESKNLERESQRKLADQLRNLGYSVTEKNDTFAYR
jgi:FkbM family methyltransferase